MEDMNDLKQVSEYIWEIPKTGEMRVLGRFFASEELMKSIVKGKSISQVRNVAKLPGILEGSYAMSDCHQGYGYCIGGVAAFDMETGVIAPGGVGYDINCSVRLLRTNLKAQDLKGKEKEILEVLYKRIPTGTGNRGSLKISEEDLDEILVKGASWMVKKGYGKEDDLKFTEDSGCLEGADPGAVSRRAKERGLPQIGSIGAGNHFLDILVVSEVFDSFAAEAYGLEKDDVVILIHCGSRGLGHCLCSY
jgi:tRNA-splicing ligase RtcB